MRVFVLSSLVIMVLLAFVGCDSQDEDGSPGGATDSRRERGSVTGTWLGNFQDTYVNANEQRQSGGRIQLTLVQNGSAVNGTGWTEKPGAKTEAGSFTVENGRLTGNILTFTFEATYIRQKESDHEAKWTIESTMEFTSTVSGDVIKGTFTGANREVSSSGETRTSSFKGSFGLEKQYQNPSED